MKMTEYKPSRKEVLEHFGFGTENMKKLKICQYCGNAQKAKIGLCDICHSEMPNETVFDIYSTKHCRCEKCGNVLPNDANYCPMCGKKQNKEREEI